MKRNYTTMTSLGKKKFWVQIRLDVLQSFLCCGFFSASSRFLFSREMSRQLLNLLFFSILYRVKAENSHHSTHPCSWYFSLLQAFVLVALIVCHHRCASTLNFSSQLSDKEETFSFFLGLRAHLPDFMDSKEEASKSVLSESDEGCGHESQGE